MSNILDAAKSHFRSKIGNELRCIEVPEWEVNGEPTKIYYRASINFLQQEKIMALSDQDKKGEAIVESLIQRALDADGKRLFSSASRTELMRSVDPEIIGRVVGEIAGSDENEDLEKN